jgi:hypothetical protein
MILDVIAAHRAVGRTRSKLRWLLPALLFWLSTLSSIAVSRAANFAIEATRGGGTISLSGEIIPGDASKFRQALNDAASEGLHIAIISLNSEGGNVRESVSILRLVKSVRLTTVVSRRHTCASSCFLIFAAGKSKIVYPKSRIGVHAASDEVNWQTARSLRGTLAVIRIAKLLGVPGRIRHKMLTTPPTQIVWLRPSDLQKMQTSFVREGAGVLDQAQGHIARQTVELSDD